MEGYFINTTGCRMLALNPFSKTALSYLSQIEPMKCTKVKLLDAKTIKGENYLVLAMSKEEIVKICNVERISDVYCEYNVIKRQDDNVNKYSESGIFRLSNQKKQIKLKSGPIVLRVECYVEKRKTVYHDVHFLVPKPKYPFPSSPRLKHLSVMIIGIDSLSHMQFLRAMPLLGAYIETLPHVEFWGYNRVGHNTYPNLMPLFSGLNETELEKDCYIGQFNYDKCNFIWQHFKEAGYNTSYAEDNSVIGTFNYGKWGFNKKPTDFYLRPVMVEVDKYTRYSIDEQEDIHCSGSRKYSEILHEFIYKMIPHLKQGPHFSISWETQGVHDYFNYPKFLDKDYLKLLKRLRSNHILSNTLVFLMSDHGLRFGSFRSTSQGMLEVSQPLLIAIYPKWLEEAYPLAISNLRKNAHSLITTFDLHATLKDLTNINLLQNSHIENRSLLLKDLGQNMPRGISLFLPIPETRDCQLASIPAEFCLCHKLHQVSSTDDKSEKAAQLMVERINLYIKNYTYCESLELNEILDAYILKRSNDDHGIGLKVRFRTQPGEGLFEGTATFSGNSLTLNGPILRINRYGNQSYCVHNYKIEMYCYCLEN
ncbi:uncharacterized protein LOC117780871 [Drosophila innubila]|uniref:uncharacterized protein LOC117780871 n=1 Tax=Drosophila innubila TaxID=198719 RepID=UPI00148C5F51|nr:uncharacterized protein LOC117780871 [Drosophila innubila]